MQQIRIKVENEEELFDSMDPDGNTLSRDVKDYLFDKLQIGPRNDEVEICVISEGTIDKERFETGINNWVDDETRKIKSERHMNGFRQLRLFLVGIAFIALSIAVEIKVGAIWYTILSTIGAFSIWEATSYWLVHNPKLMARKHYINRLKSRFRIVIG